MLKILQLNNNCNIDVSYLANPNFASSGYYYNNMLRISPQNQQLLLLSKLYVDQLLK